MDGDEDRRPATGGKEEKEKEKEKKEKREKRTSSKSRDLSLSKRLSSLLLILPLPLASLHTPQAFESSGSSTKIDKDWMATIL